MIVPMFDDRMDEPAYKAITAAFPDRRVIQLYASEQPTVTAPDSCVA